jgi:hypothetical protein
MLEVKQTIACNCAIRVRLDEKGEFQAQVVSAVEYRPGVTASATLELPEAAKASLRKALGDALELVHDQAARAGAKAAAEAADVAHRRGEM